MGVRKAGVLIGLENRDGVRDGTVGVRSLLLPLSTERTKMINLIIALLIAGAFILFSLWMKSRMDSEEKQFRRWLDEINPEDFGVLDEHR